MERLGEVFFRVRDVIIDVEGVREFRWLIRV